MNSPTIASSASSAEDIGLRLGAADGHQRDRHRDDAGGHQQHQHDAAAPPRRLVGGERLGRRIVVSFGGHAGGMQPVDIRRPRVTARFARPLLSA